MPVTSSGEIKISDILSEVGLSLTRANTSLGDLESGAVFTINTASPAQPNGSAPNSLSEWYAYDHSAVGGGGSVYYMLLNATTEECRGSLISTAPFAVNGSQDWSYSAWYRIDDNPAGAVRQLASFGSSTNTASNQVFMQCSTGIYIRLRFNGSFHQRLCGFTANSAATGISSGNISTTNRGNVNTDNFAMITVTYDASQANAAAGIKIYWNASEMTSTTSSSNVSVSSRNSNAYNPNIVTIGGLASNTAATNVWRGGIDEAKIYSRILTASEITTLYNSGSPDDATSLGVTSGLVGEWEFEDTVGVDGQSNWDTSYLNGAARAAY